MKVKLPDVQTDEQKQAAAGAPDTAAPSSNERPKDVEVTHLVPQRYNDPRKSGIKKTVAAGKNEIPIELNSK